MSRSRGTAVATALLLCAALAAAGCGLGAGGSVGTVELSVTREFGTVPVLQSSLEATESDTVMRVLEGSAEITTRYGGGFVQSIEGVAEAERGGHPYDWFFYVDGVESQVGAAEYELEGGERVWWDYRNWSTANHIAAAVGSWPAPFSDGIGGRRYPVALECRGGGAACGTARRALQREGVEVARGAPEKAIRILVGPWQQVRKDATARQLDAGPAESGIFADFEPGPRPADAAQGPSVFGPYEVAALSEGSGGARRLGPEAGLVAATSRYGGLPVWLVTGGTAAAVRAAAAALDAEHLRHHYAVAIEDGRTTPLPLEER
jgi:Domain of unknown function (DUF4430)